MSSTSSSNQSGLWVATAIAATVAIGYFYKQQQQQQQHQQQGKQDLPSEEEDESAKKSKLQQLRPRPEASQEEKKEDRRPMSEISLTGHDSTDKLRVLTKGVITIVHGSVTGTCAKYAVQLEEALHSSLVATNKDSPYRIQVGTVEEFDWWDELLNEDEENTNGKTPSTKAMVIPKLILLLPTYTTGTWPPTAATLQSTFQELETDWRIEKFPLKKKLHVGIFGMGSTAYGDDSMGKPAREAQTHLHKLGAKTIVRLAVGDDSVGNHAQTTFSRWTNELIGRIQKFDKTGPIAKKETTTTTCSDKEGADGECCQQHSDKPSCTTDANIKYGDDESEEEEEQVEPGVADLEDMGDAMMAASETNDNADGPPEMVTPSQAEALKKEGYKLIGTHSAVKLCRWTKHQLRGRGGCYKHTFYGITSYQCMEATPSLACANKCVFCWRHHKNPVGKEWKWKTDDPHFIVEEAVNTHVKMINEAKGIPGVRMDRWNEALTVRHCALSLVGEPIMYPRIDELLGDLHGRKISTFLVTNGQHPAAIACLRPITQLYVSVDAPTQESLIAIDRPLFQDAWDRLKQSLQSLKDKGQRTVARLTVVKGWNTDEVEGYAKLVALGHVSLVEVKGVTFCGKSDASNLNMTNSPWHHEVVALTTRLKEELDKLRAVDSNLPEYGLACEHKHSCSVLLARVDHFADHDPATGARTWRTWIDYDRFHELAARNAEDPSFSFSVKDYVATTPAWALMGAEEEGFDPTDTRHRRNTKHPKYAQFDEDGIPTHDHENVELSNEERQRLKILMDERKNTIGCGTTVTEMKDGAKEIQDASLMFRGLVITK
jgi:tRNA wybutosine-synthesizing protein 1